MFTLGVDIGSTTSKSVILKDGQEIISTSLIAAGTGTDGPDRAIAAVLAAGNLNLNEITSVYGTGYGRKLLKNASGEMSELSCHAKGVHHLMPEVRTIIDIGGQDAKVLSLGTDGRLAEFLMNDKCAAGTGRFLDVMAGILQLKIEDLEKQAAIAKSTVKISNTCTVFAESEVISQLANGVKIPDLVAGICQSVASRVASLAKRIGVQQTVCMSGGVARNGGVRKAMEQELGIEIIYSPMAQFMGALGAALYAYDKS
ncbi:MAG: CoA-substrate-specific enzyme activase [Lacrimispora sp.]|jgi:predicted CoA-substrate-specific enzyme activase|nr:CoA-substrate-specific enzyme activase [Lacrimispora sp.]